MPASFPIAGVPTPRRSPGSGKALVGGMLAFRSFNPVEQTQPPVAAAPPESPNVHIVSAAPAEPFVRFRTDKRKSKLERINHADLLAMTDLPVGIALVERSGEVSAYTESDDGVRLLNTR